MAMPWMVQAFSGFLVPDQLLFLWDLILGFDTLLLLPLLAAAVFSLRRDNLHRVLSHDSAETVLSDLSTIQVVPLIQMALSQQSVWTRAADKYRKRRLLQYTTVLHYYRRSIRTTSFSVDSYKKKKGIPNLGFRTRCIAIAAKKSGSRGKIKTKASGDHNVLLVAALRSATQLDRCHFVVRIPSNQFESKEREKEKHTEKKEEHNSVAVVVCAWFASPIWEERKERY